MKKFHSIVFCIFICFPVWTAQAQELPQIGAQVFIEPGQTPERIESFFRLLKDNGMTICRIRMFEEYMKKSDGTWDYSLFDHAFQAAAKYNVQIFATLFPATQDNSVGGFKFPESEAHLTQIAQYIENVVQHFQQYPALYAWVLINEPGTGGWVPNTAFTQKHFAEWKQNQPETTYNSQGYPLLVNFDRKRFLVDYNTWYLDWIAKEVKKYDTQREIHVNNHAIFSNAAEYDFPAWQQFLTSLGASAHPSWHFGYFNRSQYNMALAANCEMIRSGAGQLPFWITELQGGNNTYSGQEPFCPTAEEITQWLWTGIGTGTKGTIFWCLNPRAIGEEAGEWALADFQNQPSDRLLASRKVSEILAANKSLFTQALPISSPIHILYVRESLWVEGQVQYTQGYDKNYEGRLPGGVMKSAIAFFELLAENGIKSNFGEINEFDWSKNDYTGECIILANQIAIPSRYWEGLENFVQRGGKLIVEGLTAFYDENMLSLSTADFPFQKLFGGVLSEVICIPGDFEIAFNTSAVPVHLWKSYIHALSGKPLSMENNRITALRNNYGRGSVLWIPALVGLGASRTQNKTPLSNFLRQELQEQIHRFPFVFNSHYNGVTMQVMQSDGNYLALISNNDSRTQKIRFTKNTFKASVLFPETKSALSKGVLKIEPEQTVGILMSR